jgi:hypothetical protein
VGVKQEFPGDNEVAKMIVCVQVRTSCRISGCFLRENDEQTGRIRLGCNLAGWCVIRSCGAAIK